MPGRPGLLECIERYFAAAPLLDARIERAGALDVPIADPAWPYPARPTRDGGEPVTVEDVRAALDLLAARYGMAEHLAYAYLSAATDFDISQVVDIVCGVHARIREADFAGVETAGDA